MKGIVLECGIRTSQAREVPIPPHCPRPSKASWICRCRRSTREA
jgi:hypothetical protein